MFTYNPFVPPPIEDYALIGDCETAALVSRKGSIDWLCLPRFDSPACFSALLGGPENGRWQLAPVGKARPSRQYRKGTLILETQFKTSDGTATLIDFMPLRKGEPQLIRIVRGDRGRVRMRMDLVIRFDYGRTVPWVTRREDGALVAVAGPHLLAIRGSVPWHGEDLRTASEFTVEAGKSVTFELHYGSSFHSIPHAANARGLLRETERGWRAWTSQRAYRGPLQEHVERSLITLRALTYQPTGGIVAAATTSLPEQPGGRRNWDYRFCWLRDATFTLLALIHAGYHEEALRWRDWLARSVAGSADQVQVLYGVAGERELHEWELPWLTGYNDASPVRCGNAASEQFQLDIFGEVADVLHQARAFTRRGRDPQFDLRGLMLAHVESVWRKADNGIWEIRGPRKHFTHSKVMAWVAFDRAVKSAVRYKIEGPIDEWRRVRDEIHREVCRRGFNSRLGSFVQYYGAEDVDAALLLLPLVGFLPCTDPRMQGTVRQIEKQLMRDGFVMRYETRRLNDGLPPGEGAFLPCSFWLADNYELMGRHNDAQRLLARLLKLPNDVGLLSEEYDVKRKRLLGNFPQAFSHVALVNTIINLNTVRGPAKQRAENDGHGRRVEP